MKRALYGPGRWRNLRFFVLKTKKTDVHGRNACHQARVIHFSVEHDTCRANVFCA